MLIIASLCGLISLVLGMVLVPAVRTMAHRIGIVDKPDPTRKLHRGAIALGGGFAVFACSMIAVFTSVFVIAPLVLGEAVAIDPRWKLLLFASGLMVLLGLVDDWIALRGRQKLLGQIMIVAMLVGGGGTVVSSADFLGIPIELGVFALPITMLWLLGAVNALNLIDGADGIASTTGSIICAGLSIIAFSRGDIIEGSIAIALATGLLAFLKYNRPPASIFLGDSGSMMIGLVIGTLAIWTRTKESTAVAVVIPIAVLSIPLFDSSIAILRRVLTGRSIYAADRAHMHHVLQNLLTERGLSQGWMLGIVAVLTLIPVSGAVASVLLGKPLIAIAATGLVLGGLVLSKSFGHAELSLLAKRSASFGSSLLTRSQNAEGFIRHTSVRLQGSRDWDRAWDTLVDFAEHHDLWQVKLDLNVSWLHEGFHGDWHRSRLPDRAEQWSMRFPIEVDQRQVGTLKIVGRGGGLQTYQLLETLIEMVSYLQPNFEAIVNKEQQSQDPQPEPQDDAPAEKSDATGEIELDKEQSKLQPSASLS